MSRLVFIPFSQDIVINILFTPKLRICQKLTGALLSGVNEELLDFETVVIKVIVYKWCCELILIFYDFVWVVLKISAFLRVIFNISMV